MKVIITIMVLAIFTIIYEQKTRTKKLKALIKDQFGKKPTKVKYEYEIINNFWKEYKKSIPEDQKIDDITWNDLEMNNIFCRINQCNSFVGEQVLYAALHHIPKDKLYTEKLEKKIKFFLKNEKERQEVQLLLCDLRKNRVNYSLPTFINHVNDFKISKIWIYKILQFFLVISILPAIIFNNPALLYFTGCIFILNGGTYAVVKNKYEVNLDVLNSIIGVVSIGNKISDINKFSYEKHFRDLRNDVAEFKSLSRKVSILKIKKDASLSGDFFGMFFDYLIGGTLWDFTKYHQITCLLEKRQKEFIKLYKKIGEIDMAIAIASFRESLPFYCTPTFCEEHVLQMKQIYHPLIEDPVCNTVTLKKSTIITGSNASGKSTYAKAVAINIILAQNIHTCMAEQMIIPYARVITSMAVRDNLMAGESYYIKEIKYLNRIVKSLCEERFVICLIDEILRGTNTEERIAASASILDFLHNKNCLAIVASHDVELVQILGEKYDNYHFREQIQENDIIFDYKLHEGATYSKNAIKLLEYVGFPEEIVTKARAFKLND